MRHRGRDGQLRPDLRRDAGHHADDLRPDDLSGDRRAEELWPAGSRGTSSASRNSSSRSAIGDLRGEPRRRSSTTSIPGRSSRRPEPTIDRPASPTPWTRLRTPMPDIRPFRGVRYDMAQVGALSDVVAPPYDVIDPALQDRLYEASPYNVIRLELNREEPGDTPEHEPLHPRRPVPQGLAPRRASSARTPHPALYVYHQTFEVEGRTYTRKGFLARVRLEPFGQGKIYPHEQTLSGPEGRPARPLQRDQVQPQPDLRPLPRPRRRGPRAPSRPGIRDRTPLEATDHLGVVNRLWPVDRPEAAHRRPGPDGPEADLHRRRPPPLRDRPEVPRRPGRRRASWPGPTTRPTSA